MLSAGVYSPPLSDAIQKFKYGGVAALGEPLAPSLAAMWRARGLGAELIVPVPLHPLRERARGYNQSVLLAQQLGRLVGVPVEHRLVLRSRHTRPQVGLNPELRRANVAGAFLAHGTAVGLHVLVVDDVCTTGATLEACASALVEAGAQRVTGLTLARALWNGQGWSDGPAADAPA